MLAQAATRGQQSAALPSSPSPEPGNASSQVGGISGEGDRKARLEGAVGTGEEAELGVSQEPAEKQSEELLFLSSHPTIYSFSHGRSEARPHSASWGKVIRLKFVPRALWSHGHGLSREGVGFAGAER